MPDRRRQVELLLATRFDHLWFPAGAIRTSRGLAPVRRVPCPACSAGERPGWVAEKRGGVVVRWTPCVTCGGRVADPDVQPAVKPRKGRGFIAVDPMDAERRTVGSVDTQATARPRKRVKCDGCQDHDGKPTGVIKGGRCPHCDGTGFRDLYRFDLQLDVRDQDGALDQLTAAIVRRDQQGSYHDLDVALAGLSKHVNKPPRFAALTVYADQARRLLDEVYLLEERTRDQLTLWQRDLVDIAVDYLAWRMPDPIRVPGGVAKNARERADHLRKVRGRGTSPQALAQRDKEIRKLIRQQKPTQWVAAEFGLTVSQVNRIVAGETESVA